MTAHRPALIQLATGAGTAAWVAGLAWLAVDRLHYPLGIALAIAAGSALAVALAAALLVARRGAPAPPGPAPTPEPEPDPEPEPESEPEKPIAPGGRLSRELRESREIQQALLPRQVPAVPGYHLEVDYRPCGVLGGDFYDFQPMADGRLWITLGDVSGKGPSGAIVMAMVQTLFRQLAPIAAGPADLLVRVNEGFSGALGKGVFVTATAALLEPARHRLVLAGAGHPPALLVDPGRRATRSVAVPGLALGLVPGRPFAEALTEVPLELDPSAALLLYTDGATESAADLARDVGGPRLRAAASAAVLEGAEGALARVAGDILEGARARDDTTLLLVARAPRAGFSRSRGHPGGVHRLARDRREGNPAPRVQRYGHSPSDP